MHLRRSRLLIGTSVLALALAGSVTVASASSDRSDRSASDNRSDKGERHNDRATLVRYSTAVPENAEVRVNSVEGRRRTLVVLLAKNLAPNTVYGAHAHVNACSPTDSAAAGPHFQYTPDPVTPSTNPAYANPRNEIWLDFQTNRSGNGVATAVVNWTFPADRRAKSVIIHAERTKTGPTDSGTAGARLACLDVKF